MSNVLNLYRYEILSTDAQGIPKYIARHGMGEVYKAQDLLDDRVVALKVVQDELLSKQPAKARRNFLAEAIAGARLGRYSSHIIRVFDVGQSEDTLYMAQEWISGGNATSMCGNCTLFQAKRIVLQIGDAVRIAHKHGIVHSDIAPANILYDKPNDLFKLGDFGLLKLMNETSLSFAGGSSLLSGGRAKYMPKEHVDHPERINYSTDIYALAVTLYVLLTGHLLPDLETGDVVTQVPGEILISGDKVGGRARRAPSAVYALLDRFVVRRTDQDTIEAFLKVAAEMSS